MSSSPRALMLAALVFTMLWTAAMIWWKSPMTTAGIVGLMVAGVVAGLIWYGLMRMAMVMRARR